MTVRAGHSINRTKTNLNCLKEKSEKMYGPSYVTGAWRIKYNDQLYKLFKEPITVQSIKIKRE
jgi:hypothetical protein